MIIYYYYETTLINPLKDKRMQNRSRLLSFIFLALAITIGIITYFYTTISHIPFSQAAQRTETALANGNLVTLFHANVKKLRQLNEQFFGEIDSEIQAQIQNKTLFESLAYGPAHFYENAEDLFLSIHIDPEANQSHIAIILLGQFEQDDITESLRPHFHIKSSSEKGWIQLTPNPGSKETTPPCKNPNKKPAEKTYFLNITSNAAIVTESLKHGKRINDLFSHNTSAQQDLSEWKQLRTNQMASLMITRPEISAQALSGLSGMVAQKVFKKNEHIEQILVNTGLDLLSQGFNIHTRVISNDPTWVQSTKKEADQTLKDLITKSNTLSPTLATIVEGIKLDANQESMNTEIPIPFSTFSKLDLVAQEVIGQLFQMSPSQSSADQEEQLDTMLTNYDSNSIFLKPLPPHQLDKTKPTPLFVSGAFTANFGEARLNDKSFLELAINATMAVPEYDENSEPSAKLSLEIHDVINAEGKSVLRDERCLEEKDYWFAANHEPRTSGQIFQGALSVDKRIRLEKKADLFDVDKIKGSIHFKSPTKVKKVTLPLRAGEETETEHLRFLLTSIGERQISYRLTGDPSRLIEVRALNKDGAALQGGWSISSNHDKSVTKTFKGNIHSLELYFVEQWTNHHTPFELSDILKTAEQAYPRSTPFVTPTAIPIEKWQAYQKLDFNQLTLDSIDWFDSQYKKSLIGETHWQGAKLFVAHKPQQWGNNPTAILYIPMIPSLHEVLSALSYHLDTPVKEDGANEYFHKLTYPYQTPANKYVGSEFLADLPLANSTIYLQTGLKENQRLDELKGHFTFRIPTAIETQFLSLEDLWQGKKVSQSTITLDRVGRGSYSGYHLEVRGGLDKLVSVNGVDSNNQRIIAHPINFQDGGYWTLTIPFHEDLKAIEVITAKQQKVITWPFDLNPIYPEIKETAKKE